MHKPISTTTTNAITCVIIIGLVALQPVIYGQYISSDKGSHRKSNLPALNIESFDRLDSDAGLCAQLGTDRMLEWLVRDTEAPPESLIGRSLLDMVTAEMLRRSEIAAAICMDMDAGDTMLRVRMQRMLGTLGYAARDASALVGKWATYGPDATLEAVLASASERPDALAQLVDYLLESSDNWLKTIYGMKEIVTGKDERLASVFLRSAINVGNMPQVRMEAVYHAAQSGVVGRWEMAETAQRIVSARGAVAMAILSQPRINTSYRAMVWQEVSARIASDPMLLGEYAVRTTEANAIYRSVRDIVVATIRQHGGNMFPGFAEAVLMPASRFQWAASQFGLVEEDPRTGLPRLVRIRDRDGHGNMAKTSQFAYALGITGASQWNDAFAEKLAERTQHDNEWTRYTLWLLTRPAEAVAVATRDAIPTALTDEYPLIEKMIEAGTPLGSEFESYLTTTNAYTFYPGGAPEMRQRVQDGSVARKALAQYADAVGKTLAKNDAAWAATMEYASQRIRGKSFLSSIIAQAIAKDSTCAMAWAKTALTNDLSLQNEFAEWLTVNGHAASHDNAIVWLQGVVLSMENTTYVGNPDVARFREWFGAYLQDERIQGQAALRRLRVESSHIPHAMRISIARTSAGSQSAKFWKLFRMAFASGGKQLATVRPRSVQLLRDAGLADKLLTEIASQNPYAADAASPAWDAVASNSLLQTAIASVLIEGRMRDPAFVPGFAALSSMITDDSQWALMEPIALAHTPDGIYETGPDARQRLRQSLHEDAGRERKFIAAVLADSVLGEEWGRRVMLQVKYEGRAYAVAHLVQRDPVLLSAWRNAVADMAMRDSAAVEAMVESLTARRIGDVEWARNVSNIREALAGIIFNDRVFIEQLIAAPNAPFRDSLTARVTSLFGAYIAEQWVGMATIQ